MQIMDSDDHHNKNNPAAVLSSNDHDIDNETGVDICISHDTVIDSHTPDSRFTNNNSANNSNNNSAITDDQDQANNTHADGEREWSSTQKHTRNRCRTEII